MADGKIRIDTEIDESGLDRGLGSVDKKLKSGTKGTGLFSGGLAKVGVAAAAATVVIKKAAEIVTDLTDTYKKQAKAETLLEAAAKNNPYLDDASVKALKDYAGELQRVAAIGDEELLPYMAQLATAGRTQAQIQEIMQVAVNASASGAMSLDSAVRNLNKTYGGLAGELGETVPELRNLTAEEMKQGAAVKLLGERYKGMAAEVANNIGSSDKLKNAIGDFKETLGKPFERALAPIRTYFARLIQGWADARKAKQDYEDQKIEAEKDAESRDAMTVADFKDIFWDYAGGAEAAAKRLASSLLPDLEAAGGNVVKIMDVINKAQERLGLTTPEILALNDAYHLFGKTTNDAIAAMRRQSNAQMGIIKSVKEDKKAKEDEAARLADIAERNKKYAEHIKKVTEEREKAITQIKLQADAEKREVDQLDILNAYVASYVSLIADSGGLVTENSKVSKDLLVIVQKMAAEYDAITNSQESIKEKTQEIKDGIRAALDAIEADEAGSVKMKRQLEELDTFAQAAISSEQITADEKARIEEEYARKRIILAELIGKAEKEEAAADVKLRRENAAEALEIANNFAAQYQQIMTGIQALVSQQIEDETAVKVAELEKQYESGAISAEDYEDKLTEIKQAGAKEKYKIDMWTWSANIAAALANTALAATKALADGGGWLGAVLAASVIALGGVQLASLIANKPIPPTFATGGIVGGSSYTGDKVASLVNSGEMILNAGQQRNLFDRINNGDLGDSGPRVQVYNSASNIVKADATVDEEGIRIAIRQTVSKDMGDGRFNGPFRKMQQNIRGTRYTS
jgi:hypothetical protein